MMRFDEIKGAGDRENERINCLNVAHDFLFPSFVWGKCGSGFITDGQ